MPHGVLAMSQEIPELVETSNNLAIVKCRPHEAVIHTSSRSSVMPALEATRRKVEAVLALFRNEAPRWVLGADTVVEIDGVVLGKPSGGEEAERFLRLLSGRVHRVHTGLALHASRSQPLEVEAVATEVRFRPLDDDEIRRSLESGEWAGAAGAYRIQERGAFLVQEIRGSWSNVVGLPLEAFYGMLRRTGYRF